MKALCEWPQDRLAAELGLPRELVISVRPGPPLTTNLVQVPLTFSGPLLFARALL